MRIGWGAGGSILNEESGRHVHDALFHIRFLRDFLRRTGLTERIEEVGWIWGDGLAHYGFDLFDMEADHLNRIIAILDLPLESASIELAPDPAQGLERLEPLDGNRGGPPRSGDLATTEDDILVTLRGGQEDLDAFVEDLRALDAEKRVGEHLVFCTRHSAKYEEGTLAANFEREAENTPHIALLLRGMMMEPYYLYDGLFEAIVSIWERRGGGRG